jgi:hypothetical protein
MAIYQKFVDLDLTPRDLAEVFCEMSDEDQTQFFSEVGKVMDRWASHARDMQIHYIGGHLAECSCASPLGREFVTDLHDAMARKPTSPRADGEGEMT